jgi:hypothetical protein
MSPLDPVTVSINTAAMVFGSSYNICSWEVIRKKKNPEVKIAEEKKTVNKNVFGSFTIFLIGSWEGLRKKPGNINHMRKKNPEIKTFSVAPGKE